METTALRNLVDAGRREYYPKANLWPNGLGFDYRGWQFRYDEKDRAWYVSKSRRGILVLGKGQNPFDAYAHARPQKEVLP